MWEFLVEVYFSVGRFWLRFIFGYNMIQLYSIQGVSICILSMTTDKRNEPLKTDMELENRLLQEEIPFDNQCFWRRLLCTYT